MTVIGPGNPQPALGIKGRADRFCACIGWCCLEVGTSGIIAAGRVDAQAVV